MVEPHWVQLAEGMPPCTPAFDQSVARLELMIPDHCWAYPYEEKQSTVRKNNTERLCLISSHLLKMECANPKEHATFVPTRAFTTRYVVLPTYSRLESRSLPY